MVVAAESVVATVHYIAPQVAHIAVVAGNLQMQERSPIHPFAAQVARPLQAVPAELQQAQQTEFVVPSA